MFAHTVATLREDYGEDYTVYTLFFEERDPERGGECWQFQRALGADGRLAALGEEDEGVCVVRESHAFVGHDCLVAMTFDSRQLHCRFDPITARQLGFDGLDIRFQLEKEKWQQVHAWHQLIFQPRADNHHPTT